MTRGGLTSFLMAGIFPRWAAISSGWIVHDMLNKPKPPIRFTSAVLMDNEIYPGESLVMTLTYDRVKNCSARVDQFILDMRDNPILQRTVPGGYSGKGKGLVQKVVLPVPPAEPGRYKTLTQRTDICADGATFQRYAEFEFTILPMPKAKE